MFKDDENAKAVEFANAFLERYTNVGFGALSKREVDLMLLQLLHVYLPGFKGMSDFDTAISLRTTKRKIRGLRDEISFREGQNDDRLNARLRKLLLKAEVISDNQNMVMVQIDDAVLRGYAEKIVRSEFGIVDSSFNSSIMKLSGEKFLLLAYSVLDEAERVEAEKAIAELGNPSASKPDEKKSAFIQFKDGFIFGAGSRSGQLCVSGALALLTNGASLLLDAAEPAIKTGRGVTKALTEARDFFTKGQDGS